MKSDDTPILAIRPYQTEDEAVLIELWTSTGLVKPWNNPERDIRRKLTQQPQLFFVGLVDGSLVASVMAGYDGHRGWINYLAVHANHRRQGYGQRMVQAAEAGLLALGCPKVNLQIRANNLSVLPFYKSLGYLPDDTITVGKRLIHDPIH